MLYAASWMVSGHVCTNIPKIIFSSFNKGINKIIGGLQDGFRYNRLTKDQIFYIFHMMEKN